MWIVLFSQLANAQVYSGTAGGCGFAPVLLTHPQVAALAASEGDALLDWGAGACGSLWMVVGDEGSTRAYALDAASCGAGPCYAGRSVNASVSAELAISLNLGVADGVSFGAAMDLYQRRPVLPYVGRADLLLTTSASCASLAVSGPRFVRASLEVGETPMLPWGAGSSWYGAGLDTGEVLGVELIPAWMGALASLDVDSYGGVGALHLDGLLPKIATVMGEAFSVAWLDAPGACGPL